MLSGTTPLTDTERHALVGSAFRLSYFTIIWNGVVGATALVIGLMTGSLALAGFALNALLDSSASVVLGVEIQEGTQRSGCSGTP